ncbi:MAG TPA: hypothetical protein VMW65_04515 [Chloroflexota bacterium]|nr:hypothetical protein [Chloroflexota bacterium]
MYTGQRSQIAKLKAYEAELERPYLVALRRRDFLTARMIYERRWRIRRAIMIREEWGESAFGSALADQPSRAA